MEKKHLDRRLDQMRREGTVFRAGVDVGSDELTAERLLRPLRRGRARHGLDDRPRPAGAGAASSTASTRRWSSCRSPTGSRSGEEVPDQIRADGKHVVIIGGGDTGADCLGTAIRQGAASITQLEIMPQPPEDRPDGQPWPTYPMTFRVSSAHEEGGDRVYAVSTQEFLGDDEGRVRALRLVEVDARFQPVEGTEREIPAELVLLAMGFTGPGAATGLVDQLGVELDDRGNIVRDDAYATTVTGSSWPATPVAGSR